MSELIAFIYDNETGASTLEGKLIAAKLEQELSRNKNPAMEKKPTRFKRGRFLEQSAEKKEESIFF